MSDLCRDAQITELSSRLNSSTEDSSVLRQLVADAEQSVRAAEDHLSSEVARYEEKLRLVEERCAVLTNCTMEKDAELSELRMTLSEALTAEEIVRRQLVNTTNLYNELMIRQTENTITKSERRRSWFWFLLPWEW